MCLSLREAQRINIEFAKYIIFIIDFRLNPARLLSPLSKKTPLTQGLFGPAITITQGWNC